MRYKLGFSARSIHTDFSKVLGDQAPSYATVTRWVARFKEGREDLEDDERVGRPITATTEENIALVRAVIQVNPFSTYDDIQAETSLCRGTINHIVHDCLKMRKITSRWVPHFLSEKNRVDRVRACSEWLNKFKSEAWRLCDIVTGDESWFYWRQIGRKQSNASWVAEGESPRTVVRRDRYEPKTMVSVMFRRGGVEQITYWGKGDTITSDSYIEDCLKPLVRTINKQRPTYGCKNLKFHQDNAKPHVAKKVITFLEGHEFIIMDHPPYSPDLAPSDFWLFDFIKARLSDHASEESLMSAITAICNSIPKEELIKTFDKWIERLELCIKFKGDYFEQFLK